MEQSVEKHPTNIECISAEKERNTSSASSFNLRFFHKQTHKKIRQENKTQFREREMERDREKIIILMCAAMKVL